MYIKYKIFIIGLGMHFCVHSSEFNNNSPISSEQLNTLNKEIEDLIHNLQSLNNSLKSNVSTGNFNLDSTVSKQYTHYYLQLISIKKTMCTIPGIKNYQELETQLCNFYINFFSEYGFLVRSIVQKYEK